MISNYLIRFKYLICAVVLSLNSVVAICASLEETLSVKISLPNNIPIADVLVGTELSINIGDHAKLDGPITTVHGDAEVGDWAQVGTTTVGGDINLNDNALVEGDAVTGGRLEIKTASQVTGEIIEGASLGSPTFIEWEAEKPEIKQGDISLVSSERRDLEPSIYGKLILEEHAQVIFHSGVYVFEDLKIQSGAEMIIEDADGPVEIYIRGGFDYRGVIRSAYRSIPQLLIVVQSRESVHVQTAFTGVLISPKAEMHINSGLPDGHSASFHAKSIEFEPNTIVKSYNFDWVEIPGVGPGPDVEGKIPVHEMPNSPGNIFVGVDDDNNGITHSSGSSDDPLIFKLPDTYPVDGGIIADGRVTIKVTRPDGVVITCVYKGGSSTATPTDDIELTLGRLLIFSGCSDGLPADTARKGIDFDLSVKPALGYPVSVRSPIISDGYCSDEMELITPQMTRQMRTQFDWNSKTPVQERNVDGTYALYYAWVFIRDPLELEALRKLYIHILKAPLFTEELDKYSGRCGVFTNPGDGEGTFVPVVIPGFTYNKLITALTNDSISGDRVLFDAVIIRTVPAAARNANNSIRLDILAQSGFRYLHYEQNPLPGWDRLDLGGGAAKKLVDVLTWVGEGLRDVGQAITNTLGKLDRLFRDEVTMTFHLHGIHGDTNFGSDNPIMIRGWGPLAGRAMGASGLEVTIKQRLFDSPIPTTSQGRTNIEGRTVIKAVKDGDARGSGLCVELKNRTARVTDLLIATMLCDLRGFNPDQSNTIGKYELDDFSEDQELDIHIANLRFIGLYQASDLNTYSINVLKFRPRRARIVSGFWASTFSQTNNDGTKRLFAPCLGYPNSVSDAMIASAFTAGILTGIPVLPAAAATFAAIIGDTDIVMSTNSSLSTSREVMSHEYGHFLFCSLLYKSNPLAIDHLLWRTIASGDDLRVPTRYLNEAVADYFTGQVTGGNDYGWLDNVTGDFCDGRIDPSSGQAAACWDNNERSTGRNSDDSDDIGRIASLIHDVFDGHNANRGNGSTPGDGDVWIKKGQQSCIAPGDPWACCTGAGQSADTGECQLLEYSESGYGNIDSNLEPVALDGPEVQSFANKIASGLGNFGLGTSINDGKIFGALNRTMRESGENWCDRCRVLALHSEFDPDDKIGELFETCQNDPLVANAVGDAPNEHLRLDAASCTTCPDNHISNEDGVCEPCDLDVVGNSCTDLPPIE